LAVYPARQSGERPPGPLPFLLLPVLLGTVLASTVLASTVLASTAARSRWAGAGRAVLPAAPGWSGRWACPRARTLPGSLLAAVSGSCPHLCRADCHDSRSPAGHRTVCPARPGCRGLAKRGIPTYPPVTAQFQDHQI